MRIKGRFFTFFAALVLVFSFFSTITVSTEKEDKPDSEKSERIEKGKQLVEEVGCGSCHTPKVSTSEGPVPDSDRLLSGYPSDKPIPDIPYELVTSENWYGFIYTSDLTVWAGHWGVSFPSNLTPDPETGIGNWTEEMFIGILRTGRHIGKGREILPPMPWEEFAELSDEDLKAIFAYLKSIKPVKNKVPEPIIYEDKKTEPDK